MKNLIVYGIIALIVIVPVSYGVAGAIETRAEARAEAEAAEEALKERRRAFWRAGYDMRVRCVGETCVCETSRYASERFTQDELSWICQQEIDSRVRR